MPEYIPGVCNIGRAETKLRRKIGWIFLIVTIALLAELILIKANPLWRLSTFIPATVSAIGFLQAQMHFCVAYADQGIFNFDSLGKSDEVTDKAAKTKDKNKGNQIKLYAALIGAAVAAISYFILL